LVKSGGASTAALSRDHSIHIDANGLLTIAGGKWTTYRHMAEDCVNRAAILGGLPERDCVTRQLRLHGYAEDSVSVYGSDAAAIAGLGRGAALHPALPYTEGEVIWAVREEMARSIEDVLARRTRALLLNARAAMEMAPRVGEIVASELGCDTRGQVEEFLKSAAGYLPERASR
jgi:glycerol-3-phosphate dehydrogenase